MNNLILFPFGRKPKRKKVSLLEQMELEAWKRKQAKKAESAKHNDSILQRLQLGKYNPAKRKGDENNPS